MKFKKFFAVALVFSAVALAVILPTKTIASVKNTNTIYDVEPVVAQKSELVLTPLPSDKPTYYALLKYTGNHTKVIIPDEIDGLPITNLSLISFYNNDKIEYVRLSKNIKHCTGSAFRLTPNLKTIDVDKQNPKYISKDGFVFTTDLRTLVAAPGNISGQYTVPKNVEIIGKGAFDQRFLLEGVKMYNSVQSIEDRAFSYCYNLKDLKLSDNIKLIGSNAFEGCEISEVRLPASLESVGNHAFIGGIDSNNNIFYYTTKGFRYVPGTFGEKYAKSLDLPTEYLIAEPRTISDIDTKTVIIDNKGILPKAGLIDVNIKPIAEGELKALAPTRYSEIKGYDISLTINGQPLDLKDNVIIKFGGLMEGTPKTVGKVYSVVGNTVKELPRDPQAPFVGTQSTDLGKFIVLANNDFSNKGDVDGNGVVSLYDVRIALAHTAGLKVNLTGEQIACANMDDSSDGIRLNDVREILKKAAGITA